MKKNNQEKTDNEVRLDKWLWAARFYKTRLIAKAMIEGGKVHYNGQRAKVSKAVEIGATLKLRQGNEEKEIVVTALSDHVVVHQRHNYFIKRQKKVSNSVKRLRLFVRQMPFRCHIQIVARIRKNAESSSNLKSTSCNL